jgi:hypothetical protein
MINADLAVNQMFYTPVSQQELIERVEQIAKASDNPAAVWTAVMMTNNFLATQLNQGDKQ